MFTSTSISAAWGGMGETVALRHSGPPRGRPAAMLLARAGEDGADETAAAGGRACLTRTDEPPDGAGAVHFRAHDRGPRRADPERARARVTHAGRGVVRPPGAGAGRRGDRDVPDGPRPGHAAHGGPGRLPR